MTAFDWAFNINSNWKIKNRFLWEQWDMNYFDIATGKLRPNNQLQNRFLISGPANQETFATNIDLLGNFELLGMKHDVLIGGDFFHNGFNGFNENYTFGVLPPVDIFNPIHGVIDIASLSQLPRDWNFMRKEEWFGIYFQDQITLWDKLHILGGGRYDWANDGSSYSDVSSDAAMANFKSVQNQKFSPRVGVVYQPQDWISLYGNYTESLGSNNGLNNTGSVLAPEIGEQFEGGIKTEFFDKRLSSTIAYYHLVKNNIVTTDVNGFSVPIGGARSRGIEADIKGRITDQINLVATYAFTDARVIKNNDGILGKRLANVPEHQASLWGTYNFTDHFKMGLGGVAVGRKSGDPGYNPDVVLPGYVTMDAMVSYALPVNKSRLTTQLNFYNLLDKDYYAGAYNRYHITTGTPLSVMGSLRYEF